MRVEADEQRPIDAVLPAVLADCLRDGEDMRLVETCLGRGAPVPGSAEGHALRREGGVGPFGVIGGDQARDVDEIIRRSGLSRPGCDARAHAGAYEAAVRAELFSVMLCISSRQDLTKDCAPSLCSRCASAATSIPARSKRASICSASPPSSRIGAGTLPFSANASSVFSGMVSMVSGAASASTYSVGDAFGSLTPVLAQSMRCGTAPRAASSLKRLPSMSSR